ncbi:hypothetical protein [Streptomyces aculeolatus]|uniref:hypothetical protein n=1 Tax=Streptomyces aculeolatus TaxID=270689 RepID=UPI001CECC404|nr:hypothetical protein [Streptomyces aculeolatus]
MKVFGPKWRNPVSSSRCHANCLADGVTVAAFSMICAFVSELLIATTGFGAAAVTGGD